MIHLVLWTSRFGTAYRVAVFDLIAHSSERQMLDMADLRKLDLTHGLGCRKF